MCHVKTLMTELPETEFNLLVELNKFREYTIKRERLLQQLQDVCYLMNRKKMLLRGNRPLKVELEKRGGTLYGYADTYTFLFSAMPELTVEQSPVYVSLQDCVPLNVWLFPKEEKYECHRLSSRVSSSLATRLEPHQISKIKRSLQKLATKFKKIKDEWEDPMETYVSYYCYIALNFLEHRFLRPKGLSMQQLYTWRMYDEDEKMFTKLTQHFADKIYSVSNDMTLDYTRISEADARQFSYETCLVLGDYGVRVIFHPMKTSDPLSEGMFRYMLQID